MTNRYTPPLVNQTDIEYLGYISKANVAFLSSSGSVYTMDHFVPRIVNAYPIVKCSVVFDSSAVNNSSNSKFCVGAGSNIPIRHDNFYVVQISSNDHPTEALSGSPSLIIPLTVSFGGVTIIILSFILRQIRIRRKNRLRQQVVAAPMLPLNLEGHPARVDNNLDDYQPGLIYAPGGPNAAIFGQEEQDEQPGLRLV